MPPRDVIRRRRLRLRLSQEAAAKRAGVSRQVWNGFETGRRGVGEINAARIAGVLGGRPRDYLTRPTPTDELADLRDRVDELERRVDRLEG